MRAQYYTNYSSDKLSYLCSYKKRSENNLNEHIWNDLQDILLNEIKQMTKNYLCKKEKNIRKYALSGHPSHKTIGRINQKLSVVIFAGSRVGIGWK